MEVIDGLIGGFQVAFTPSNLLFVALGVLVGTVTGLLPGLGPVAAIAVLLPLTFHMEPTGAIIMLAGIYYGAMFGSRIPAILVNLPGDATAVITTLDGHPLAKQGRAGPALGITAIGSFLGGTLAILGLTFAAPFIARYAVKLSAPEMFILAAFGMLLITFIGTGSKIKALVAAMLGLLTAAVGMDAITGEMRFTFDSIELSSGIGIVPIAVGLFGFAEIIHNIERGLQPGIGGTSIGRKLPTWADWVVSRAAILRAGVIGFFIGILPGGGGTLSSILAYGVEKRFSKNPEKFGKGAIDGLAATETADNASSNSSFIPMLTLGLPPNPTLALIFGALLLHNITPGPQLVNTHPEIFWGVIASMYVGNILLLILNLPMIGVFIQILRVRQALLVPFIALIAIVGVYSARNSMFDVMLAIFFGIIGYAFKKFRVSAAPFMLAFILGPMMEREFRRAMLMSNGEFSIFIDRPISATMLAAMVLFVGGTAAMTVVSKRRERAISKVSQSV